MSRGAEPIPVGIVPAGIDIVTDADVDRRARELAAELGARVLRSPSEVEGLLERRAAASRARDARGTATEARLLAAALEPEGAHEHVTSLLAELRAAQERAARVAAAPVLAERTDPELVRAAAAAVMRATATAREAQTDLGAAPADDDDAAAERSIAAARAVLAGAKAVTPNAAMRLGYVAAGNGIALLLVGLGAPSILVVSVLCLVVIAGVHQLIVARRTATAEELGMRVTDVDDWHRRAAQLLAADEARADALRHWHDVAGADVGPDQVDELLAATAAAGSGAAPAPAPESGAVTWPEQEWAAALARLELDPCPAAAPDRALAQLGRRLTEPGERERAGRRLDELLEGRGLADLLDEVVACADAPVPSATPVVLADPLRDLEPGRRDDLLRRLAECDDCGPVTLVTTDAAATWPSGSRGGGDRPPR